MFSTSEFQLTEKEQEFIRRYLAINGCGATNPEELLCDNYSCQCIEDLRDEFSDIGVRSMSGLLSSLEEKGVFYIERRDGLECTSKNRVAQFNFEPDLYWVNEMYLESLPENVTF